MNHPQKQEVTRLLVHLIASGFRLVSVDDGGEHHETPDAVAALPHILGVDESLLLVTHPDLKTGGRNQGWIEIVLGNGPGELCSDYMDRSPLRECIEAWADAEEALELSSYDSDEYDTEAMAIDQRNGNFSPDRAEDYRHENIVRTSLVNGQFNQAKQQCHKYGLNYETELLKHRDADSRLESLAAVHGHQPQHEMEGSE